MRKLLSSLLCLWLFILFPIHSSASVSVPYKTETISADGNVIETQTAYIPIGLFGKGVEIVNPEDIFIDANNHVYIVDSGTKSVTKFDDEGEVLQIFGEGLLQNPLGVYVDHDYQIFVADYGSEKVLKFNQDGELLQEFGRPDSPLFGTKTPFKPQKVSIDLRGNLYIIAEGSTNGIIQLNQDGNFLGFYGVNTTRPTLASVVQEIITTQRQRASLFMRVPPAPNNITIDEKGLVYTITSGTTWEPIRKLNVAGANMLNPEITDVTNLRDLAIGPIGNIYTIGNDGIIYEYDRYGNLLFIFGGRDDGTNRLGLTMQPSGIEVDNLGRLFVTDREHGVIQVFEPTEFTIMLHRGLALYAEGHYIESEEYWNEILRLNSSFGLAHTAMGQALYKQQMYDEAIYEFELANDLEGYSDAFWEIRNRWLQEKLSTIFMIFIGLFFTRSTIKYIDKKKNILQPLRDKKQKWFGRKLINELLFLFRFIKHPLDSFYYLKENERVSVLSATILYAVLFIEYLLMMYWTGFLFNQSSDDVILLLEIGLFFGPILLFIVTNYLVSTINDGEGRFRDVYIGTIYSLAPFIIFILPITLISNVLTFNEAFIYTFSMQIIVVWSAVILFMMIKEVHDFTFFGTIRNILITIFGMFIAILVFFVIYILLDQVYEFVKSIIQEVILRV